MKKVFDLRMVLIPLALKLPHYPVCLIEKDTHSENLLALPVHLPKEDNDQDNQGDDGHDGRNQKCRLLFHGSYFFLGTSAAFRMSSDLHSLHTRV